MLWIYKLEFASTQLYLGPFEGHDTFQQQYHVVQMPTS